MKNLIHGSGALSLVLICAAAVATASDAVSPLNREVDIAVKATAVENLLQDLEPQIEPVRLKAVPHLRERRMTFQAKRIKLGDLMQAIAATWSLPNYPATWVKEGGSPTFVLRQRPESALEGKRLEAKERAHLASVLAKLKNLPADDTDGLTRTITIDPTMGPWNAGWSAAAGAMFRELPPGVFERGVAGEEVPLRSSSFSPTTQGLLFRNLTSLSQRGSLREGASGANLTQADFITETPEQQKERFATDPLSFVLKRDDASGRWSPVIRTRGKNRVEDQGTIGPPLGFSQDASALGEGGKGSKQSTIATSRKGTLLTLAQRRALTDAAGSSRIRSMADFELVLNQVIRRPVSSDYYAKWLGRERMLSDWVTRALAQNSTLEGFLDSFTRDAGYRWSTRAGAFIFRSRMWWVDDEGEVPSQLWRKLVSGHDARGYLTVEELAAGAELTEPQLRTLRVDFLPDTTVQAVSLFQPWGRLFASLPPQQRSQLEMAPGLLLGELTPENIAHLSPAGRTPVTEGRFKVPAAELLNARLQISQELISTGVDRQVVRTWIHLRWPSLPEGRKGSVSQEVQQMMKMPATPPRSAP